MKIIGENKDGFIVEISRNEAYRLQGYYSQYSREADKINVGDSFDINEMYEKLNSLNDKRLDVDKCVQSLRNLADLLEPLQSTVNELVQ